MSSCRDMLSMTAASERVRERVGRERLEKRLMSVCVSERDRLLEAQRRTLMMISCRQEFRPPHSAHIVHQEIEHTGLDLSHLEYLIGTLHGTEGLLNMGAHTNTHKNVKLAFLSIS